jgi:hypothetical protein
VHSCQFLTLTGKPHPFDRQRGEHEQKNPAEVLGSDFPSTR